jgi:putative endonuclease
MQETGFAAEDLALEYLVNSGLRLVSRNYRCRFGEIDLIMREADTLVFVEVRLRSRSSFGGAAESITAAKRGRLLAAARCYLSALSRQPPCRFDVVTLDKGHTNAVRWLKDAFGE